MQQFRIESEKIRDKLNTLLPSQNAGSIGVELTGSTQIIPIVDLTEIAEGSNIRQDLQTALSLISSTAFAVRNTTTTIINTTGYFRIFGSMSSVAPTGNVINISITDGTTTKILFNGNVSGIFTSVGTTPNLSYDFVVFLQAGDSVVATSGGTGDIVAGVTRQIADLSGNLVNP